MGLSRCYTASGFGVGNHPKLWLGAPFVLILVWVEIEPAAELAANCAQRALAPTGRPIPAQASGLGHIESAPVQGADPAFRDTLPVLDRAYLWLRRLDHHFPL